MYIYHCTQICPLVEEHVTDLERHLSEMQGIAVGRTKKENRLHKYSFYQYCGAHGVVFFTTVSFKVNSALVLDVPLTNSPLVDSISLGLDLKVALPDVNGYNITQYDCVT